jgi:hypothetical protein
VSYGPFNTLNTAISVGEAAMADGTIVNYYIQYTDVHGGIATYEQV